MLRNINRLIFPVLTALVAVPVGAYAGGPVAPANAQLAAATAAVGHQLNDAQMDTVTAGQALGIECAGCTLASSTSMSANGTTTSMSSTGVTPGGAGGGGTGGTGTGGTGTGGTGSGGTSSGGPSGPTGPSVLTSAPTVPANLAAIIGAATSGTITNP
jgi:hypothetical protein